MARLTPLSRFSLPFAPFIIPQRSGVDVFPFAPFVFQVTQ